MGNLRGHNNIGKLITKTNSAENQFGLCGGKSQSVRSQKNNPVPKSTFHTDLSTLWFSMDRNLHSTRPLYNHSTKPGLHGHLAVFSRLWLLQQDRDQKPLVPHNQWHLQLSILKLAQHWLGNSLHGGPAFYNGGTLQHSYDPMSTPTQSLVALVASKILTN